MVNNYKIGFARTALITETILVAKTYQQLGDWEGVKQAVKGKNLLQTRTVRSSEIIYGEISTRLSLLDKNQIDVIAEGFSQDVRQLVWVSLCKQYSFICDFTIEVLAIAHQSGRTQIDYDDYGYFYNSKADWHPELERVSDKTRSNARQALFQMMRQCELLTDSNQLITQTLSSAVQNCSPESDLVFLPGAIRL